MIQRVKIIIGSPLPCKAYFFVCFDQMLISIKCQMKSMTYTVLESYAYDNVLVIKYFLLPQIFHVRTYAPTVSCRTLGVLFSWPKSTGRVLLVRACL